MKVAERIRKRRLELNMTQEQLANAVFVTPQAVSLWEKDLCGLNDESIRLISKTLGINREDLIRTADDRPLPSLELKEQFFSDENMYRKLKEFAQADGLEETDMAIDYAREKFAGQKRKTSGFTNDFVPAIVHSFIMACQAHALGIGTDEVMATALLHDVCEDCRVAPEELPFSENVREAVCLLTKTKDTNLAEYYEKIAHNSTAAIVKVIDRCNNVSTMVLGFSDEKLAAYIEDTETYVFPLMEKTRKRYPQYYDAVYLLKYQMLSCLESAKAILLRVHKHSID